MQEIIFETNTVFRYVILLKTKLTEDRFCDNFILSFGLSFFNGCRMRIGIVYTVSVHGDWWKGRCFSKYLAVSVSLLWLLNFGSYP